MKPIHLEIVTRVLTTFGHCRHCEVIFDEADIKDKFCRKDVREYPRDLVEEYVRLSDWVLELSRLYQHRLLIRIIDVQSVLGVYKSFRHWIRSYPTFIIEGKQTYTGWDRNCLESLLDQYINSDTRARKTNVPSSGLQVKPVTGT